jgi:hypothetical protein
MKGEKDGSVCGETAGFLLAYTNSRLETGVQPAKSDMDETDVYSLNP